MCLAVPGQVVAKLPGHRDLARVDVGGVGRVVNIGLLDGVTLEPGDWVLIHVGFAMSKIDEAEAAAALAALEMLGGAFDEELAAMSSSTPLDDWGRE